MSEKSCKLCDLYGICGARTAGCVKDPDEGCPFYRYFKKVFQPRWIPISEKWPEDCQEVFVTTDEGNMVTDVFHVDSGGYYFEGRDVEYVKAWMPLPAKPESEEEK